MFVSAFTFCRNLVRMDYPFLESIRSVLPLVDEFIVVVGDSEDKTLEQIQAIKDPRIKIIETVWDMTLKKDGLIYAQQTNIALEACNPSGDWAFYIQGDEVLHEKDLPGIRTSMEKYKDNRSVLGLMMRYYHFVGDYWSLDPWAYRRALRIVRPWKVVRSVGDAVGFARTSDNLYIGKKEKDLWRFAEGRVYHYGWVKDPKLLREKVFNQVQWYWEGTQTKGIRKLCPWRSTCLKTIHFSRSSKELIRRLWQSVCRIFQRCRNADPDGSIRIFTGTFFDTGLRDEYSHSVCSRPCRSDSRKPSFKQDFF